MRAHDSVKSFYLILSNTSPTIFAYVRYLALKNQFIVAFTTDVYSRGFLFCLMYGTVDHNQFGRGRYCFLLAVNSEDTFTDGTSKGQFLSFLAFAFSHPKTLPLCIC